MNTEQQIGFDKVKEMWKQLAVSSYAKEKIAETGHITDEKELLRQLKETTDSRNMIEKLGTPPLQDVTEIREILKAAVRGDCLTPYQLERVEKVLVVVERLKQYLARGKQYGNPLAYYDENLDERGELREEIVMQIRNEAVDDRASKVLFDLRTKITATEEAMKQKADQLIRSNKDLMADSYHTLRNGRICVPVKKEYRFRIPGSVIDKSATGNTVFIEPAAVAKLFEELQLLRVDEENEVYRILYTLSSQVADALPAMEENMRMIEKLDLIFSRGKLSIDLDCSEPAINLERRIVLKAARHPLLDRAINVPLDFEMGKSERGIVITGPNTGGKTVAIKTVMINCYMAQCGLHVPCGKADICMNSSYLSDIGDGQDLSENLSTFSAHIKNVLAILTEADRDSFVIMDELGSGTDPAEGMGIAVAILTELLNSGANFLVTTHYPEVKDFASKNENIVNARMTFDKETLRPTYRMVIGEAGESCAFYIAERLGMPGHMLETAATAAYGEETAKTYSFGKGQELKRSSAPKLTKVKTANVNAKLNTLYNIGDSVMVYPEKKIGIVCETVNSKGTLRVQVAGRKFWINHKRVKLHVKAEELYPEDYDLSIVFDSVEDRKIRHDMQRKYTEEVIVTEQEALP
ncbi:MAG: DNA mismatch repair protein MutS [Lachnospiraceae bacterium]|nr:DNA mismatch repair protein MutS [Lachnospiraceae bacterium]